MNLTRQLLDLTAQSIAFTLLAVSVVLIVMAFVRWARSDADEQYSAEAAMLLFLPQIPYWLFFERVRYYVFVPEFLLLLIIISLMLSAFFGIRAHDLPGRRAGAASICCLVAYGLFAVTLKFGRW